MSSFDFYNVELSVKSNDSYSLNTLLTRYRNAYPLTRYNKKFIKLLEYACIHDFYDIVRTFLNFSDCNGQRLTGIDFVFAKIFHLKREKISSLFYVDDRILIEDKIFYLGIELYMKNFENFKIILDYNPDIDPTYSNNELFIRSCAYGCSKIMLYLYQKYHANPADQQNRALQRACENNHVAIAQFLLTDERVNPADRNDIIFRSSVRKNRSDIVKLLLKYKSNVKMNQIDPSVNDNISLKMAFENQNFEIMKDILNSEKCYDTPQIKSFLANDYLTNEMYDEVVKFYMRKDATFDFIVRNTAFIKKRLKVLLTRFHFRNFIDNQKFNQESFTLEFTPIEAFKIYFMNRDQYSIEALKIVFGIRFEELLKYFEEYETLNKLLSTDPGSIIFSYL